MKKMPPPQKKKILCILSKIQNQFNINISQLYNTSKFHQYKTSITDNYKSTRNQYW